MMNILPVILSGGSGTRLWPASRAMYPKQLLPLAGEQTMLQATAMRTSGLSSSSNSCIVVCNETHRFLVSEQLSQIDFSARIILEPEGRNTAPAIALAAHEAGGNDDPLLLVMPADHVIQDVEGFQQAVARGAEAAESGSLVTFGIVPTRPETGFGYIRAESRSAHAVPVQSFVEKPDLETARELISDGHHYWNSGMFLFKASAFIGALSRLAPEMAAACEKSMAGKSLDGDFVRPEKEAFLACPSDSIDYAVMEKAANVVMVALDVGWSDVGSWAALQEVTPSDEQGNSTDGDVLLHDCEGSYFNAESRLVAAVGLKDVIVVENKDSVLIADKSKTQDVKALVDKLKASDRPETNLHRQVFRPWGSYDSLDAEANFQVKRLIVKPGAVLSLQKHAHRSEHWVCVRGKCQVTRNDEVFDLNVNESTYVAIGDVHRIANPYDEPAHIIEVQCGDYLGEDDIERLEDNYGREGTNT